MAIEISKIVIKVNKTKLELSLEDARALFGELNQVFGPSYNPYPLYLQYPQYPFPGYTIASDTTVISDDDNVTPTIPFIGHVSS